MKVSEAITNDKVSYQDFYKSLKDSYVGSWEDVSSTTEIYKYVKSLIQEGLLATHILQALEDNHSTTGDWEMWLGQNTQTPTPIHNKQDLAEALCLSEEELNSEFYW